MAALVLLCGCGRTAEPGAEEVRAHFAALDSCTAHLKIISDFEQSVLEFESDYVYNREDSDSFLLTAPESVAGIGGRISGEENAAFTLQYQDLQLDDIAPRRTGLTPADGWFCLMNDLRYSVPDQMWSERTGGQRLLVLRYTRDQAEGSTEKQVWLRQEDLQPVCAELYENGALVLTIAVESYQQNGNGTDR